MISVNIFYEKSRTITEQHQIAVADPKNFFFEGRREYNNSLTFFGVFAGKDGELNAVEIQTSPDNLTRTFRGRHNTMEMELKKFLTSCRSVQPITRKYFFEEVYKVAAGLIEPLCEEVGQ